MGQQLTTWTIVFLLSLVPNAVGTDGAQMPAGPGAVDIVSVPAVAAPVEVNRQYEAYGFLFEQYDGGGQYGRFSAHEIDVLGQVVVAYAGIAGGLGALSGLVDAPVRVRRDLQSVVSYTQAGQVIGLGRGAFDLAVTEAYNYYAWGATSGDELAQIVFGHEIGHRWVETLRRQSGVDWGAIYARNVWRGERASAPQTWEAAEGVSPEEEAVTNLALYALDCPYRWTFLHDAPAGAARQVWVDGWIQDLVSSSS